MKNDYKVNGKVVKEYYSMTINFPVKYFHTDREEVVENLAKKYGGDSAGAGTDFKTRDMSFDFLTLKKAKQFYEIAFKKKLINKSYYLVEFVLDWDNNRINLKGKPIKDKFV